MLSFPIEKEIRTEHKVIKTLGFELNLRQTVCVIIGLVFAVIMYFIFRDVLPMVVLTLPVAAVLVFIARKDENGRKAEDILQAKMEERYFKTSVRKYRTKNGYVPLLNRGYSKLRREDQNNKKVVRMMKKDERITAKRIKKSKIRTMA